MYTNIIGHCNRAEGNQNKIYIASVRENHDGTWSMVGKWGRVGGNIREKVRFTGTLDQSLDEMVRVFEMKEKRGYVNILSPDYSGELNAPTFSPWLEKAPGGQLVQRVQSVPTEGLLENNGQLENNGHLENNGSGLLVAPVIEEAVEYTEKVKKICEVKEPEDLVVVCRDNQGLEAQFTVGVEYLADGIDHEFIQTWNKFGELTVVDKERFEVVPG